MLESQSSRGSVISNESEKLDLLVQLDQLRSRVHIVRDFDLRSNVIDMKKEEHRVKRSLQLTSSFKFQQKMLMAIVSGLEYANKRFDPFSIDLDGWSENIFENIKDFNTMFERLFEKYCKKGEMAPALEFMIRLAGSAFMFNMSNQLFKNIKGPSLKNLRQTVCNAMSQQAAPLHAHNFQVHDLQTQQMPPPNQQVHHVPPPPPPQNYQQQNNQEQDNQQQNTNRFRDVQLGLYNEDEKEFIDQDRFSIASSTESSIQEPMTAPKNKKNTTTLNNDLQ